VYGNEVGTWTPLSPRASYVLNGSAGPSKGHHDDATNRSGKAGGLFRGAMSLASASSAGFAEDAIQEGDYADLAGA
jgi:hypothetical protein